VPFLLSPPLNALVVGLIYYKKWKWAFGAFSLLITAFLFLPPSQPLAENYIVPLAVSLGQSHRSLADHSDYSTSKRLSLPKYLPILFFFICFVGNQVDTCGELMFLQVPAVYQLFGFLPWMLSV